MRWKHCFNYTPLRLDSATHPLLELRSLCVGHAVRLAHDGDDVDPCAKSAHELDVHLPKAVSGVDEVEEAVYTVVPEARVTLDTGLLGENVVVLPLEEADDLLEGILVVDVVTKPGRVHNGKADAHAILVKLDVDGLDADALLDVSGLRVVRDLVSNDLGLAEGVNEGGLSCGVQ